MGILGGVVPEITWESPGVTFSSSAYTQDFSDAQIMSYAKAVLAMESGRQLAYQQIERIIGKTPPPVVCNEPDTLRQLPSEAQKIAVDYCVSSRQLVQNSGLSVSQFNAITIRVQSDKNLERRIQNTMIRLRQKK
jgi:hypothetical protein